LEEATTIYMLSSKLSPPLYPQQLATQIEERLGERLDRCSNSWGREDELEPNSKLERQQGADGKLTVKVLFHPGPYYSFRGTYFH